ncbi:MAG: 4Fe-4S dicluster domain-containing protein [Candidatus Omnitrophica bacterium]|nr:4Fe-4S dicluster domain-containing protein [Candidatus Omnitrophota bacterium]MBU1038349.1 4Fe-4S dicluster domain-containing protein [Candidatus Omnitrophota bacterium]MBU1809466.1 4Fe-4S dicluster domain-containing protein [Candidatus Omnitrophota bacterium]
MKRLLVDLDECSKCDECGMLCSYIQHPDNNGITTLREFGHFAVVCRRCDDAPCVASCPWEALELVKENNMIKRHMMRCTSCKSCSRACPFGVIYPETIPLVIARCDYCLGRLKAEESPVCLQSCDHGGIRYGEFEENKEEGIFKASEHLLVKTNYKWDRVLETPKKK